MITNNLGQPIGQDVDGWSAATQPPRTSSPGVFCRLEPLNSDLHAVDLFNAFAKDEEHRNWTYMPYGPFPNLDSFQDWLNEVAAADDPLFHTVVDSHTSKAMGLASYLRIDPAVGVIEVGHIHFSKSIQKKPAATEAMYLMMKRVFDELGYRRYEWKCDALNEPSRKAALRLGFTFEGIFRQATMYKGRNRDTAWFSVLDSEWPTIKSAFENWLKPENFDPEGQQKNALAALRSG